MADREDRHRFIVTAVELAEDDTGEGVAIRLTDIRGGQVTLQLADDMAELLRQKTAEAIARNTGP